MNTYLTPGEHSPRAEGAAQRKRLCKATGVRLITPHRGNLPFGDKAVDIRIEPDETIVLSLPVGDPPAPADALRINRRLPGNLRFAVGPRGTALVADTPIDGEAHLSETFSQFTVGLMDALNGRSPRRDSAPNDCPSKEQIGELLADLKCLADAPVQRDDGYEVRCRAGSASTTIHVGCADGAIRLQRTVVPDFSADLGGEQAARQALRVNAQLRHARLAATDTALVAEARLTNEVAKPPWVAAAIRAVAVAANRAEVPLRLLAEQPHVAECYRAVFSTAVRRKRRTPIGCLL
jgi:hypothetical protein